MTSARDATLAAVFQRARPRLIRVAYATTGSYADAEDIVSDCWLRLVAADRTAAVNDVDAWATVAVARAALDTARSARRRRVTYTGPWLPEPIVEAAGVGDDPSERVALDQHVSYALLVILERLSPAERVAWVLHDLFGMPFLEIAATVGRTPVAVRQLASRARNRIKSEAPRTRVTSELHDLTVRRFRDAAAGGDLAALLRVLDHEVVLTSDGGGRVRAAKRPIRGGDTVARFARVVWSRLPDPQSLRIVTINGQSGMATYDDDRLTCAVAFGVVGDRIVRIDVVRAPEKLSVDCSGQTSPPPGAC